MARAWQQDRKDEREHELRKTAMLARLEVETERRRTERRDAE